MKNSGKKFLDGSSALVMGLGLHGGGVATAKWLAKNGAKVTATDLRDKKTLAPSLRALRGTSVKFVLGRHRAADFRSHDIIVVNPGVPRESKFLRVAARAGKRVENVAALFFAHIKNPTIAVTGTRGKTTTTLWIAELLKKRHRDVKASGSPENALLDEYERISGKKIPAVAELSSWQLEYLTVAKRAPHIAVITNLYPDHQNRYRNMRQYALAKANIFLHQGENDALILNRDNEWYRFFLVKKPKGRIFFVSTRPLPKHSSGICIKNDMLYVQRVGKSEKLFSVARFRKVRGEHNLMNLLCALLVAKLEAPNLRVTEREVLALPTPRMRQEVIYRKGKLTVVNDSCATSPDGTIAAIRRFAADGRVILIVGGTDKELEFGELAREIARSILPDHVILLEGSATTKLVKALRPHGISNIPYDTLDECIKAAFSVSGKVKGKVTILFSPAAASFEKYLHEFDRGEAFSKLVLRNVS